MKWKRYLEDMEEAGSKGDSVEGFEVDLGTPIARAGEVNRKNWKKSRRQVNKIEDRNISVEWESGCPDRSKIW